MKSLIVEHVTLSNQYASWGMMHNIVLRASLAIATRISTSVGAVSRGVADDLSELSFFPKPRIKVLSNPIKSDTRVTLGELATAETFWTRPKGKRILSVGSLKSQKNHELLLRAFKKLNCDDASLLILGKGSLEQDLVRISQDLLIDNQVIFGGFHNEVAAFYQTADLFVLSSDYEGFGNVIVEALASGTPVVSTDCPSGPSEILEGGRLGRLTPVGDVEALAEAIRQSLSEAADTSKLIEKAKQFDPGVIARNYLSVLQLQNRQKC